MLHKEIILVILFVTNNLHKTLMIWYLAQTDITVGVSH